MGVGDPPPPTGANCRSRNVTNPSSSQHSLPATPGLYDRVEPAGIRHSRAEEARLGLVHGEYAGADAPVPCPSESPHMNKKETTAAWKAIGATDCRASTAHKQGWQQIRAAVEVAGGFIPICCGCQKVRDRQGHWIRLNLGCLPSSEVRLTHGMCPECMRIFLPELHEGARC